MKILSFIVLLIAILVSCTDTLKYDANFEKELVGTNNNPSNETSPNKFKVDSVSLYCSERIVDENTSKEYDEDWVFWRYKTIKKEVFLDTTETSFKIWLDVNIENQKCDYRKSQTKYRYDSVKSFRTYFAATLREEIYMFSPDVYDLNLNREKGRWFEFTIHKQNDNKEYIYNGNRVNATIMFNNKDEDEGIIEGNIYVNKIENLNCEQTREFVAWFKIYY